MKVSFLNLKGLLIIFILLLSIPIFQSNVYWLLVDIVGVGYAYFIDQFLPLIVTSVIALVVIKKNVPISIVKSYIVANAIPILVIIISCLVVHGWILGNYFFEEEPNALLRPINNSDRETPASGVWRNWGAGIYVLSYELFYTKVVLYNIVTLILYVLTAIILYVFLRMLFIKKVLPALIGALFFVTTPAYMDMFSWQMDGSGMPIALSTGILSLIFLFTYQKNSKPVYSKGTNFVYYLLSIMFYLSMLKISFYRMHAFISLPLFMCLFPLVNVRFYRPNIKKFILTALPFLCILLSYLLIVFILPNHVFEKGIKVRGAPLNTGGYLGVLSMLVAYLFIPSETALIIYPKIKEFLVPSGISLTLLLGVFGIGLLIITSFIALRHIRQLWGRLVILALIAIFANLVLTPFLIQGYNNLAEMDQRFSNTGAGNGPGLRYVFVSAFGLSMLVAVITAWVVENKRKCIKTFLAVVLTLLVYYSYLNVVSHINALKNIHPVQSAIPNSIFSMVPKDGKKKLLYSVNPKYNAIDAKIGDWIHAFYTLDELIYINPLEDVRKLIASGMIERDNFYAFYNNPQTLTFKDVSELVRSEFYDNKIDRGTITLNNVNLTTSYTEANNHISPLVLNRGVYKSSELNQRILSPQKLSFSIKKKWLPVEYPYVDGYESKGDHQEQSPLSIWDRLRKKPSIDNQAILNTFLNSPSFNSLALIYACAEDVDWEKQSKTPQAIGGIWDVVEFPLNSNQVMEQLTTSLTCFGSVLRKIILIGPPFPSEITIQNIR